MKKAVLEGAKNFVIKDIPEPKVGPGEILIKVHSSSICGSDLHAYKDPKYLEFAGFDYLGHQFSGDIVNVGEGVDRFKVGDRVVGSNFGAYAEYVKQNLDMCGDPLIMPDDMTFEEGSVIEQLSVGIYSCWMTPIKLGDVVVVLGSGTIGNLVAQCAKAAGAAKVYITEIAKKRIEKAKEFGFSEVIDAKKTDPVERIQELTEGMGPDIVFECAGQEETFRQMLKMLAMSGMNQLCPHSEIRSRGVIVAMYEDPITLYPLTLDIWAKYITRFQMDFNVWRKTKDLCLDLIQDGRVDIKSVITKAMPFENINDAFKALINREELEIVLNL